MTPRAKFYSTSGRYMGSGRVSLGVMELTRPSGKLVYKPVDALPAHLVEQWVKFVKERKS